MYFGANCALASISAFLPTIITTFGYSGSTSFSIEKSETDPPPLANALAQLLTVPPYAVAAVFLCLNSYVSDRLQSRGPFVAYVSVVAAVGYVYVSMSLSALTTLVPTLMHIHGHPTCSIPPDCCSPSRATTTSATSRPSASSAGRIR